MYHITFMVPKMLVDKVRNDRLGNAYLELSCILHICSQLSQLLALGCAKLCRSINMLLSHRASPSGGRI